MPEGKKSDSLERATKVTRRTIVTVDANDTSSSKTQKRTRRQIGCVLENLEKKSRVRLGRENGLTVTVSFAFLAARNHAELIVDGSLDKGSRGKRERHFVAIAGSTSGESLGVGNMSCTSMRSESWSEAEQEESEIGVHS